jgi:NAD(P)-dependent dehydrogenase (short-subunit alcohol dehydrogenase family)
MIVIFRGEIARKQRRRTHCQRNPAGHNGHGGEPESHARCGFSKWVRPSAVAQLIVWLASEAGKDVNGAVIPVYGSDV